jgi:flagellar basal body-associated protein FliL
MSENRIERAEKHGFAKDAQDKVLSKYDDKLANEILEWIKSTIEEDFDTNGDIENVKNQLRNGDKLCK